MIFDSKRLGIWTPALVIALGVGFTLLVAYQFSQIVDAQDRARFDNEVFETEVAIARKIDAHLGLLRGGAGLMTAADHIDKQKFARFVERLRIGQVYQGIQGYGWSARVPAAELDGFVAARRAEGDPDFHVWPPGPRDEYHVITYLEPLDARNHAALGYDMFTQAERRLAMERARDTRAAAMSGRVALVQEIDERRQPGFLVYVPVYATAARPASVEEARRTLRGFVYSPLRAYDFFEALRLRGEAQPVRFTIYDSAVAAENLLYDSSRGQAPNDPPRLSRETTLDVAGRTWIVRYASLPVFEHESNSALIVVVLVLGTLTSLLGGWMTWEQVEARVVAQDEVAQRLRVEQQRGLLLRELQHRIKNMLSVVLAIADQTARAARSIEDFRPVFAARLGSLANTHQLLVESNWTGSSLQALVAGELSAHAGTPPRIALAGPEVMLDEQQTVSLGMVLHELATNAAKYGALSVPEGRVQVTWSLETRDGGSWVRLTWAEQNGPPVAPPQAPGFGTKLVTHTMRRQMKGDVAAEFDPKGLRVTLTFPLQREPEAGA